MIFLRQKFAPISLSIVDKLKGLLQLVLHKPISLWHRLTPAERLYTLATLLLIFTSNKYGLVAFVATIALCVEFWPIFTRIWHSLAGKAVILLFYAIIANFALVSASSVVNEVVGVSATSLTYTHNFAILLYLPIWLFGITVVVLALMQIGLPIYLLLLLLLKPFGMKGVRLVAKSDFPVLIVLIRLVMSFLVLFHLISLTDAENEFDDAKLEEMLEQNLGVQIEEGNEGQERILLLGQKLGDDVAGDKAKGTLTDPIETTPREQQNASVPQASTPSARPNDQPSLEQAASEQEVSKNTTVDNPEQSVSEHPAEQSVSLVDRYLTFSKGLIAQFAFNLESDSFSRCAISTGANIIELNDYEILEVIPDESQEYQYRFEVKKCVSPAFPAS